MRIGCACDGVARDESYHITCLECGTACCPACTFILESATYCVTCAESIVGGTGHVRPVRETSPDHAVSGMAVIRG